MPSLYEFADSGLEESEAISRGISTMVAPLE